MEWSWQALAGFGGLLAGKPGIVQFARIYFLIFEHTLHCG